MDEPLVQRAMQKTARNAVLTKRVTRHTFQHTFATHLLADSYDIRTLQESLATQARSHDDDLHPSFEPRRTWWPQSLQTLARRALTGNSLSRGNTHEKPASCCYHAILPRLSRSALGCELAIDRLIHSSG